VVCVSAEFWDGCRSGSVNGPRSSSHAVTYPRSRVLDSKTLKLMKDTLARFALRCLVVSGVLILTACATPSQTTSAESLDNPATSSTGAGVELDSYMLGQGDQISIQVFDEPDLTMQQRVGASGVINYSYLGDLQVSGKSAQQLEREITTLLRDGYLVSPSVNVTVVEYRPFFINGEVARPGSYPYQPGLTLDKAIALAGGLTDRASTRRMFIQKQESSGSEVRAVLSTPISPGDIVSIEEGFF